MMTARSLTNQLTRLTAAAMLTFLAMLASGTAIAAESVRLGMFMGIARDLNRSDAHVALELWADELTRKFQVPAQVFFYDRMDDLRQDFDRGRINLVVTDAMSFVRHFRSDELADGFAAMLQADASLLLLARDSQREFDFTRKRVALVEGDDISSLFLETLCLRRHRRDCANVPLVPVLARNNHQAASRLLFDQADYALVNRYGYQFAVELNPQLGRIGTPIETLSFDTQYFGFFDARVAPAFRHLALRNLPATQNEPRGRQLLEVFRVDQLALAEPAVLKPFYALNQEYRQLKSQARRMRGTK